MIFLLIQNRTRSSNNRNSLNSQIEQFCVHLVAASRALGDSSAQVSSDGVAGRIQGPPKRRSARHVGLRRSRREAGRLYYVYQSIQSIQKTFFVIALLPRRAVGHFSLFRHSPSLGEVYQPSSGALLIVNYENAAPDDLMFLKEIRAFKEVSDFTEASRDLAAGAIVCSEKACNCRCQLMRLANILEVRERRFARELDGFDAEALLGGRRALLAELHVAQLGDRTSGVFGLSGRVGVKPHHLLVKIGAGACIADLILEECAGSHLDVHDMGVTEAVEQILKLYEALAAILEFAVIARDGGAHVRAGGQGFVGVALGVVARVVAGGAALPHGAGARGRQRARVPRQLEPFRGTGLQQSV